MDKYYTVYKRKAEDKALILLKQ